MLALDIQLFRIINGQWTCALLDALMPVITKLDNFLIPMALCWILLFWKGNARTRATLLVLLAAVGASDLISSHLIKPMVGRVRPCHMIEGVNLFQFSCKNSLSFPSSHATNIACACLLLGAGFQKRMLWPLLALVAFAVGYSRVYVGLHYPVDVAGGWMLGAAIGFGFSFIIPPASKIPLIQRKHPQVLKQSGHKAEKKEGVKAER